MRDAYRRRCRDRASSPGCDCDDDDDDGGDDVGRGEGTVSVADANLSTGYPPDLPDNGVENRTTLPPARRSGRGEREPWVTQVHSPGNPNHKQQR